MHERLVEFGGQGVRGRVLGRDRAGEVRISRFIHNASVTIEEMVGTAADRTRGRVAGLHVLAIQDTSTVRGEAKGRCLALHPVIAVDAAKNTLLGLIDAKFLLRQGGRRDKRKALRVSAKESRRWLDGANAAATLVAAGAAQVTVIADREGDIYEDFACKPPGVEVLIRAAQNRRLVDGSLLFAKAETLAEAGRMMIDLPAAPGRQARKAVVALRFCKIEIARPVSRKQPAEVAALPDSAAVTLVEACEVNAPAGVPAAHWRLLTTHTVTNVAQASQIVGFYRQRWNIEQLFRTLKTKGFDVEALRHEEGGPFEKLVAACLVAAITVQQLVHERDGAAKRPLGDAIDPKDQAALEAVSTDLEGKTARQKNPHPKGSLAFAAWVFARLGGWTGYYGKPGPIVILAGLVQFKAIKHGWSLKDV